MDLGDPQFVRKRRRGHLSASQNAPEDGGDHGLGNGVHLRQETRFPLKRIDKEGRLTRRKGRRAGPGQAVSKIVTLICRDLPCIAETQTPFSSSEFASHPWTSVTIVTLLPRIMLMLYRAFST